MNKSLRIFSLFLFLTQICFAQWYQQNPSDTITAPSNYVLPWRPTYTTHIPKLAKVSMHPSFYDRKSEWKTIIKEFWGPGESLAGKLAAFDTYQNFARAKNPTFLWNPTNWDSLASILRSRINDSTSRGEFSRILNDLAFGMKDAHAVAYDNIVLIHL